jgi:hypothetical protein
MCLCIHIFESVFIYFFSMFYVEDDVEQEQEEQGEDDLEGDFSQTLPPLSPAKGHGSRGSTGQSKRHFTLQFPRITSETKVEF